METLQPNPAGDAAPEIGQVFRDHSSQVFRTMRALGVAPAALDDALQEVFVVVHRRLGEFEGRAKLSTWLYAITYRVAQNQRRQTRRHDRHSELGEELSTNATSPAEALARKEAADFLLRFCASLPEERRDVFVLCVLEERAAPEVAEVLNLNLNTVYSRLRVARLGFREAIENFHARTRCA